MLNGYTPNRGESHNALQEAQLQQRAIDLQQSKRRICDIVYVYDYDHVRQTVDVVLASSRRSRPISNIPIAGTGGHGLRNIRAWKGVLQTDKPDIGVLVYPKLGGMRTFIDFIRRDASEAYSHIEETAVFFGGIPAAPEAGETKPANVVVSNPAMHEIGKDDNGLIDTTGAGFLLKVTADGKRRVILRADEIYFLGLGQTVDDAQAVARQGDAGDGLGGAIAGGSAIVFSG